MSAVELTARWLERASDWANPILVKETRQSLKSRQFVITFMLLLIVSWLISVLGMWLAGDAIEFGATGRDFFSLYYLVLSTAIFIVVPYSAYRSLLNERDQNTFDLLNITTLSPRQIVWGKLLSALVQVFIFYSAIAPFIAFTSLLQGFDVAFVAFVLTISMLISLGLSMLSLMFSTVARQRHFQALTSLVVLGALVIFHLSFSLNVGFMADFPFDNADFWWGCGMTLVTGLSFLVLAQQITVAQLTFESDNRSTAIRITCSAQFWLFWIGYIAFWHAKFGIDDESIYFMMIVSGLFLTIVGIFSASENDFLSRRIRRNLPRRRVWRFLLLPLIPGGSRGFLFLVGHLLALQALVTWSIELSGTAMPNAIAFATALGCYILIYLGLGSALGRWGRRLSSEIRPAHTRVLILLLFAAGSIGPLLPATMRLMDLAPSYSLLYISNPFSTLWEFERNGNLMDQAVTVLLVAACLTLLVNAMACLRGTRDILTAQVKPRTKVEADLIGIGLDEV